MLLIIQKRKIWFILSGILVLASIFSLILWQLKLGLDFTGGSLMELSFKERRPSQEEIKTALSALNLGTVNIQPAGEQSYIFRLKDVDEALHQKILEKLRSSFDAPKKDNNIKIESSGKNIEGIKISSGARIIEKRFDSIGPVIGRELKRKSIYAIIIVVFAIILYIAWAFRKVSQSVSSWKYGVIAAIALFHDVLITAGVFSVLGRFLNVEIDTFFIVALLTVLGYSVNDTIVVFDRIRENLPRSEEDFEKTVNRSINETMARSINTSLTTLLTLFVVYFFGGETIKNFVLALIIGITAGTYSSIFLASPLMVVWHKRSK